MAATNNPLNGLPTIDDTNLCPTSYTVAGILTTIYGLNLLGHSQTDVAALYLLHPRLQAASSMASIAAEILQSFRQKSPRPEIDLIVVCFDQRNHGTRYVTPLANETWRQGNPLHAQDMFSIYSGTARDVSTLIDFLPSYLFPKSDRKINRNLVLGVSLGGHAAWLTAVHEPRIDTIIVVIGCPDYLRLMSDRARLSNLASWASTKGQAFVGSEDFPKALVDQINRYDPAAFLLGHLDTCGPGKSKVEPGESDKTRQRPILREKLSGKRILCLSGGKDKLVPYRCSEPFQRWLHASIATDSRCDDGTFVLEDVVDPGAGHEFSPMMRAKAISFIIGSLAAIPNIPNAAKM